jgi:hypothetical protein
MKLVTFQTIIIVLLILILVTQYNRKTTTFQHNDQPLTIDSYLYVREYKKQLIKNTTDLLDDIGIKFVLAHGNLIEFARGKPILHDDDIDIRFDHKDFEKWKKYCKDPKDSYNLVFDNRINSVDQQLKNGIQVHLKNFNNRDQLKTFPNMDIHLDLVANNIKNSVWMPYDIDFQKRREITYLGEKTYVPSEKDTHRILKKEYGDNLFWSYKKPNSNTEFVG